MMNKYKKTIKTISYYFSGFLFSIFSLEASFFSPNDLREARLKLSSISEPLPEIVTNRPNLVSIVSKEAIRDFWEKAKKVEAGSSSAQQSEGVNREHSELFLAIKNHSGLVAKNTLVRKTNWVLVSWGQLLATEISSLTAPLRRDQYIGTHLNHLTTVGHRITKEEESYKITEDDLLRVEKEMSLAGNRLLYSKALREKGKAIASARNRQKEHLKQHQARMKGLQEELQSDSEKGLALKLAYAQNYKGDVWERAILTTYAQDLCISMGDLRKVGAKLQCDDILYGIKENIDLVKWMTYWRSYSEDEKSHSFLEKLESIKESDDPFFVALLKLQELEDGTLMEKIEKDLKKSLSRHSLKALMAPKNKMLIELKRHLDHGENLMERFLHPTTLAPRFVMAGENRDVIDLSRQAINFDQPSSMDRLVLDASPPAHILEEPDKAESSSKKDTYHMEMDPQSTYIYDFETGKYVLSTSETVLPSLFITMEKSVHRGWIYNAHATTFLVLGESSGYVHINEDGSTARAFNISQKTVTPFSEEKKDSEQVGTLEE